MRVCQKCICWNSNRSAAEKLNKIWKKLNENNFLIILFIIMFNLSCDSTILVPGVYYETPSSLNPKL